MKYPYNFVSVMTLLMSRVREVVVDNYLSSQDFNGISVVEIAERLNVPLPTVCRAAQRLLSRGSVTAVFGDIHPNPAIKALPDEPKDLLLKKFRSAKRATAYIYPSRALLRRRVRRSQFEGRPFTLRLALGEPQLTFIPFDPAVLEIYRNDPRYLYRAPIVVGSVTIHDDYYRSRKVRKHDKIHIASFGLCFDSNREEQAIAAFLYDLARLPAKHQIWWDTQAARGRFKIHPAYWRWANGHFPNTISVLDAIPSLLKLINSYAAAIERPPLFRRDFDQTPREYGWLLRPTRREFSDFAQLLDKMLGENINVAFFRGEVAAEEFEKRRNGVVVAKRKWKPRLLAEWLSNNYTGHDKPWEDAIDTFREIRELRNVPAHSNEDNVYDPKFVRRQRALAVAAFRALRDLHQILATHPDTRDVKLPRWMGLCHPVLPR